MNIYNGNVLLSRYSINLMRQGQASNDLLTFTLLPVELISNLPIKTGSIGQHILSAIKQYNFSVVLTSSNLPANRKRNLSFTQLTRAAGVNKSVHTSGQTFQITKKIIWPVSRRVLLSGSLILISHDANESSTGSKMKVSKSFEACSNHI